MSAPWFGGTRSVSPTNLLEYSSMPPPPARRSDPSPAARGFARETAARAAKPGGLGSRTVGGRAQARGMAADQPSLPGSTRRPVAHSRAAGTPDPAETVDVT